MPVPGLSNSRSRNRREDSRVESPNEKDDYYKEFGPPDERFEEVGPDARVYRVYMKEAAEFDKNMVQGNKDGVDVILVFAGLFSAVVTVFLVEASGSLRQDQSAVLSSLLYELVQIQRASAQGGSAANVTESPLTPNTQFTPNTISVWVNGLWACSLAASLCAALFAVLVKQWLHYYESFPLDDGARYRSQAHVRQYRYLGFQRWGVTTIVTGPLPIILHISLALFLIGLALLYIHLLLPIAVAIAAITAAAFLLYLISNILPFFNPQCPYQTQLTRFLRFIIASTFQLSYLFSRRLQGTDAEKAGRRVLKPSWKFLEPMKERERGKILERRYQLEVETLYRLYITSTRPNTHSIVVQALGALRPNLDQSNEPGVEVTFNRVLRHINAVRRHDFFRSTREEPKYARRIVRSGCEGDVERIMRSLSIIHDPHPAWYHSLSIDMSTSTISPTLAISMLEFFPSSTFGEVPRPGAWDSKVFLLKVIQPKMKLYPFEWEVAFLAIFSEKWSMGQQKEISSFLLLILPALVLPKSDELERPHRSQLTWSNPVNIITFTQEMTSSSFLWDLVQNIIEAFERTVSAGSPLLQSSDMKARVAMNMVVFALDRLGDDARINAANKKIYLRLLSESLVLLNSVLCSGQDRGLVRDTYASFPSLCTVLIDRTKTEDDDDREVLNQIRAYFMELIWMVLSSTPVLSPRFMDVVSLFACSSVVDRNHRLRSLVNWKDTVDLALESMSTLLSSNSEGALKKFVDEDWVNFLCGWLWLDRDRDPVWASSSLLLIHAFAEGLTKYKDTHHKLDDEISLYIFRGDILLCAILMLGFKTYSHSAELDPTRFLIASIARLVSLVPFPVKWAGIQDTLRRTLSWREDARRTVGNFPLKESFRDLRPSYREIGDEEVPLEDRLRQMMEEYEEDDLRDRVQKIVNIIDDHLAT